MTIEQLANKLSTDLNKYFNWNLFDLYTQLNVSETTRPDVFYKLQAASPTKDSKDFSCTFYIPSLYANLSATQQLDIEQSFKKQFVLMLRELCLMSSMRAYVAEILSDSFNRPLSLHDDTDYLLDLVLNSFYDDLMSGKQKPVLNILLAPIMAYVFEGTEMENSEITSCFSRYLNIFHTVVNPKSLKHFLTKDASTKLLKLPIFLPPLKKWDVVRLKYGSAGAVEGDVALYVGNELQDMKNIRYVVASNPLISSHLGCSVNFPVDLVKNGMNSDGSYMKPLVTLPNFYSRPRNNDFADGLLDFRRLRVVGLGARLEAKVTKDDEGKDIVISDEMKNLVTQGIKGLLGLNDRTVTPKSVKDATKLSKSGDRFKDTFTIDKEKVSLDMVFCEPGEYTRPVHNSFFGNIERKIRITKPFLMLDTKVSKWLYFALTKPDIDVSSIPASFKDTVVSDLSWFEAVDFCNRLSLLAGLDPFYQIITKANKGAINYDAYYLLEDVPASKRDDIGVYILDIANGYRLPSEAEWEYAALAGTTNRFGLTDKQLKKIDDYVFLPRVKSIPKNVSLRERAANAWGIHDLMGRHVEYCSDTSGGNLYAGSQDHAFEVQIDPISIAPPMVKAQPKVSKGAPNTMNHEAISVFNRAHCIDSKGYSFNSFRICRSFI